VSIWSRVLHTPAITYNPIRRAPPQSHHHEQTSKRASGHAPVSRIVRLLARAQRNSESETRWITPTPTVQLAQNFSRIAATEKVRESQAGQVDAGG
jgi:hypothetical protein